MNLAETLECKVPSPNAVKDAVIYCVTNPTNAADIWAAGGGIVTAVATFVLAIFAIAAWLAAKKNLKLMEGQVVATARASTDAIENDIQSRQIEALTEYTGAWLEVLGNLKNESAQMNVIVQRATIKGLNWRTHHWDELDRLAPSIEFDALLSKTIRENHGQSKGQDPNLWDQLGVDQAINTLFFASQKWQREPGERAEADRLFIEGMRSLRTSIHDFQKKTGPNWGNSS